MEEFTQNTPEWEEMRKGKIGASDAPIIMGASKRNTPFHLWEQKLGLAASTFQNPGMKRGHELEDAARCKLEEMTGLLFRPAVKIHSTIPWMIASLDAISLDGNVIAEIKCLKKETHERIKIGKVPEDIFPQLQHQMEVADKKENLLFSYYLDSEGFEDGVIVPVSRDDEYIRVMMAKEKQFYMCMKEFIAPPMSDRDYEQKDLGDGSRLKRIRDEILRLKQEETEERVAIINRCEDKSSCGGGIYARKILCKGSIDYTSIPELEGVDLEPYRKPEIKKWTITLKD